MSRLEDGNLLDPIMLPEGEVDNFIKRHVCGLCRGKLTKMFAPDRLYFVHCREHGNLAEFQTVKWGAGERADQAEAGGMRLLNEGRYSKQTAEEILKSLGF
jgi:hypothetical protein